MLWICDQMFKKIYIFLLYYFFEMVEWRNLIAIVGEGGIHLRHNSSVTISSRKACYDTICCFLHFQKLQTSIVWERVLYSFPHVIRIKTLRDKTIVTEVDWRMSHIVQKHHCDQNYLPHLYIFCFSVAGKRGIWVTVIEGIISISTISSIPMFIILFRRCGNETDCKPWAMLKPSPLSPLSDGTV